MPSRNNRLVDAGYPSFGCDDRRVLLEGLIERLELALERLGRIMAERPRIKPPAAAARERLGQ